MPYLEKASLKSVCPFAVQIRLAGGLHNLLLRYQNRIDMERKPLLCILGMILTLRYRKFLCTDLFVLFCNIIHCISILDCFLNQNCPAITFLGDSYNHFLAVYSRNIYRWWLKKEKYGYPTVNLVFFSCTLFSPSFTIA